MDPKRTELNIKDSEQTKEWLEAFESKIFREKLMDVAGDLQVSYRFLSWCGLDSLMVINRAVKPRSPLDIDFVELNKIVNRLANLPDCCTAEQQQNVAEGIIPHLDWTEQADHVTDDTVHPLVGGNGKHLAEEDIAKREHSHNPCPTACNNVAVVDEAPQQIKAGQDGAPSQDVVLRVTLQAVSDSTQQQQRITQTTNVITADASGNRPHRWPS